MFADEPRAGRPLSLLPAGQASTKSSDAGHQPSAESLQSADTVKGSNSSLSWSTTAVYRHVIRPTIKGGATVMDNVFGDPDDEAEN
jgi:hypothetical protein